MLQRNGLGGSQYNCIFLTGCGVYIMTTVQFKFQNSQEETTSVLIEESDQSEEYGAIVWPCATVLSCFIIQNEAINSLRVLELGCGVGLCGLSHALKNPSSKVIMTDCSHESTWSDILDKNISLNKTSNTSVQVLNWGSGVELRSLCESFGPFDLIIASDCLFDETFFNDFLYTLSLSLSLGSDGCFALVAYNRRDDDQQLDFYFKKWGLEVECISLPDCDDIILKGKHLPDDWDSTVLLWKVTYHA